MKLQDYKDGEIHKRNGSLYYQSKSGKTVRKYKSIEALVKGENGTSNKKPKRQKKEAEVVEAVTD